MNVFNITTRFLVLLLVFLMTAGCKSVFLKVVRPNLKAPTFLSNKKLGVAVLSPDKKTIIFALRSKSSNHLYKVGVDGDGLVAIGDATTPKIDSVFVFT